MVMAEGVRCRTANAAKVFREKIDALGKRKIERFEQEVAPLYSRARKADNELSEWYWREREKLSREAEKG